MFEIYARTEIGLVRAANEDHILVGRFIKNYGDMRLFFKNNDDFLYEHGLLFAIADGIGGELGGAIASSNALWTLEQLFYPVKKNGEIHRIKTTLIEAVKQANITLLQQGIKQPELAKMGCTLAGICLTMQGFLVFNSGDSRVYRYRYPHLKLLTEDDTVTQIAVRNGKMTIAEARRSEQRHRLTNFLGYTHFSCKINEHLILREQDIILICSDGLHDLVSDNEIEAILDNKNNSLPNMGQQLAKLALKKGGYDNISLILVRLDNSEQEW